MIKFGVKKEKESLLIKRMEELNIFESDIQETFIRSGGPGGQNTNKVATCVQLKHLPSGIVVKCQKERSQSLNRFLARRELVERIENKKLGTKSPEQIKIEKIRKQKARRKKKSRTKHQRN